MEWESFEGMFHESWHSKMRPFIESEECDNIYKFLKKESKRGKKIVPLSSNVYRCFLETPYDELKVVLMGMSPYHTLYRGLPVADGLLMGCSITGRLQPSLEQFYGGMERELDTTVTKTPNLDYLAHQGVLMFNAALTTEINKAGSHMGIWEPFVKYLFEQVLDVSGVPIVFLGKEAAKYKKYVAPFTWTFSVNHPAYAAYKRMLWDSENMFTNVNKVLMDNNGYSINWTNSE